MHIDFCDHVCSCQQDGFSPLHMAAENGYLPIVDYFIVRGAQVNVNNKVDP